MKKIRWGVISTAKIGTNLVIPAMQHKPHCEVVAIGSRNEKRGQEIAAKLGIPKVHGSYEALLADPDVDAIYNPLPNHLHLEWAIKTLEAGKHLLSEKPLTLNVPQAEEFVRTVKKYPHLKVMEAFMYRHHVQWQYAKKAVQDGVLGDVRTIQSFFAYYNDDPANIRNIKEAGGGALLDIGCYCISLSRFIFNDEPERVMGMIEADPNLGTDRMISGMLDFSGNRTATFTASTQLMPYQHVNILGTKGRIEIDIPFNAPREVPCKVWLYRKTTIDGDPVGAREEIPLEVCNQYERQGELFCKAILNDTDVPTPIEDGLANMMVIEAFRKSAASGAWATV